MNYIWNEKIEDTIKDMQVDRVILRTGRTVIYVWDSPAMIDRCIRKFKHWKLPNLKYEAKEGRIIIELHYKTAAALMDSFNLSDETTVGQLCEYQTTAEFYGLDVTIADMLGYLDTK